MYQPNLFRTLPNRSRLLERATSWKHHLFSTAFRTEEHPVIWFRIPNPPSSQIDSCPVLTTYSSSLSEPIISPVHLLPIWVWCGLQDDEAIANRHQESSGRRLSSILLARTYTNPTEPNQPSHRTTTSASPPVANFSLCVYLLAKVALVHEENGLPEAQIRRPHPLRLDLRRLEPIGRYHRQLIRDDLTEEFGNRHSYTIPFCRKPLCTTRSNKPR